MLDPQAYPEVDTNPVDPRSARPSPAALPYPGARWWSFDFHAHTPASADTPHWQQANGTDQEVTPERWLVQFMAAGMATTLKQLFEAARLLACSPWSGRTSIALFRQRQALARRWARLGREV